MDTLKNPRFWITLSIVIAAGVLAALKVLSGGEFSALVVGMLVRLGADRVTKEETGAKVILPFLFAVGLLASALLSGCACRTPRGCLAVVLTASGTASELAIPIITESCKAKVRACGPVKQVDCPAYGTCIKLLDHWRVGMADARKILDVLNSELAAAGVN